MDDIYGNYFFTNFKGCGEDYTKRDFWEPFFDNIAQNLIDKFNPSTVLDAGCAMGYLVEALRKRGVKAYGFDISEYAISNVAEKVKPYCFVHSITDELPNNMPQKFDLVITIETLEHLFPDEGSKAIKNLCKYSDTIIFTSTPSDIENLTHLNVQQAEYWCKEFAKNSFFRDHILPMDFICEHAMLFKRKKEFENVIFNYELYNRVKNIEVKNLTNELSNQISNLKVEIEDLKNQILDSKTKLLNSYLDNEDNTDIKNSEEKYKKAKKDLELLNNLYSNVLNSKCWKVTKPLRIFGTGLKTILKPNNLNLKKNNNTKMSSFSITSRKELAEQKKVKFEKNIKFSIIVPLYNTPQRFLKEMIESVKAQTYSNWELCLADGSDNSHSYVEKICKRYLNDKRIKYKKLQENLGISDNTNACIDLATGDYIALFDHDDVLHPSALFENAKVINEQNADFIYTDEAIFEGNIKNIVLIHFKPDFALDYVRANNYICHFTVFKKNLLDEVGLFRKDFNGSQDHDMVLRLTEKSKNIVHIPKILYYWRRHKDSVASDTSAKPYAAEAGIKAVKEHLNRCNLKAEVESSKACPTIYRLKYEIQGNALVSIIIPNKDHIKDLSKCVRSIIEKSTYKNFEIIIVENNSNKKETFDYYDLLKNNDKIKIVEWKGKFNYSAINNFGIKFAKGDHIIFLNNDIEVIAENWIEEMLMYSQRSDVGAVGAKLYYPDSTIQHGGVVVGLGGFAGHLHINCEKENIGYMARLSMVQNYSAVTGACMMIPRHVFDEVNGLDELFKVSLNDIDLCMRIRKKGYNIVWTPYAELYHYESKSRGYEDTPEKRKRFNNEVDLFKERWKKELEEGDPYYNPNLTLERPDCSIK